jgi:hypothetical protein
MRNVRFNNNNNNNNNAGCLAFLNVFRSLFRRAVEEQRLVRVVCLPSFMGNLTCTTQREKEKEKRMK